VLAGHGQEGLVAAKRAERTHDHRMLFREKLAWFFGRHADDINDAEKIDVPRHDDRQLRERAT
jgi:hypothetical protein